MLYKCCLLYTIISYNVICRFKDGLSSLGVLQAVRKSPTVFEEVFCSKPPQLTAQFVENMFSPSLSVVGSSNRTKENQVLAWWMDYLIDVEGWKRRHLKPFFPFLTIRCAQSSGVFRNCSTDSLLLI